MLISVVTVNLNNGEALERTIKSVIAQDHSLYEFVVIDGGSTDASCDIIKKYEKHIDFYLSESDSGVYNAMNKSLQYVKGDYVIFMNSGDEFASSDVLKQIVGHGMTKDIVFAGWNRKRNGAILSTHYPSEDISFYDLFYRSFCVSHQATFTKVNVLRALGGYDESLRIASDVCFLMKALVNYNKDFEIVKVVCANFDITGMSGKQENQVLLEQEKDEFFAKNYPLLCEDYKKLHKFLRFKPKNIVRHIKWRLFRNKR